VSRILRAGGVSWQATKTWKASNDPRLRAEDAPRRGPLRRSAGRVICVDEYAPSEPATPARTGLARRRKAGPATGHVQPHPRCPAHDRRTGPGHRQAGLPDPRPQRWREFLVFADDLDDYRPLVAVTDNVNQAKGDQDPATWLPPYSSARCRYITEWTAVKIRWRLTVDSTEKNRLSSWANACPNVTITVTRAI